MSPNTLIDALSADWVDQLLAILRSQHELVGRLSQLAESQQASITSGRTEQLLELLAKRQAIIDEFTSSQVQLNALTSIPGGLSVRLQTAAAAQRHEIQSLIEEIGGQLADVMRRDQQDQQALRGGRDQVKAELAGMGAARHARNAYQVSTATSNVYTDHHV